MSGASGRHDSRMSVEASSFDGASTSQVRLMDAYLGGLMEGQRGDPSHQEEDNSEDSDNLEAGTWCYKEEFVARKNIAWGQTLCTRNICLQLSINTNQFTNAVFSVVCDIYGKYHDESMGDLNVHLDIWRMFMYSTLQALIFTGEEYNEISFGSRRCSSAVRSLTQVRVISSILHGRRIWRNYLVR